MTGQVLVQLAGHVLDPNPISQTVRSTFGEFWRTHQVQNYYTPGLHKSF